MALSFSDGKPVVLSETPYLVTKNTVTVTLDGSATSGAFAGIAHGGPAGRTPFEVTLGGDQTLSSSDAVGVSAFLRTADDTSNDETDGTIIVSAAGTNAETCTVDVIFKFLPTSVDDGRTAPVGYTAPANTSY